MTLNVIYRADLSAIMRGVGGGKSYLLKTNFTALYTNPESRNSLEKLLSCSAFNRLQIKGPSRAELAGWQLYESQSGLIMGG